MMTREKHDRLDNERLEGEQAEAAAGDRDEIRAESEELPSDVAGVADGAEIEGPANSATDETLPTIEAGGGDEPQPERSIDDAALQLPSSEPVPPEFAGDSLPASTSDPSGQAAIAPGDLAPPPASVESGLSGVEAPPPEKRHDPVLLRAVEAFKRQPRAGSPYIPRGDAPLNVPPRPAIEQVPLTMELERDGRRVHKRLEIEVVVTVTNQERIATITSEKMLRRFSELADFKVFQVSEEFRMFRDDFRIVWGRR